MQTHFHHNIKISWMYLKKKCKYIVITLTYTIELQKGTQPPFKPIYNLYQNKLTKLQSYIDENLLKNFVCHLKSNVSAPLLFVKKKYGSLHMGVDYHGIIKFTIKKCYFLPLILKLLEQLGHTKVFTKVDFKKPCDFMHKRKQ